MMSDVHDYDTKLVAAERLDSTMVLVGESGGLSAIYGVKGSSVMPGMLAVETEHGTLYLDIDLVYEVLR
jgi:hypothetical protein